MPSFFTVNVKIDKDYPINRSGLDLDLTFFIARTAIPQGEQVKQIFNAFNAAFGQAAKVQMVIDSFTHLDDAITAVQRSLEPIPANDVTGN